MQTLTNTKGFNSKLKVNYVTDKLNEKWTLQTHILKSNSTIAFSLA